MIHLADIVFPPGPRLDLMAVVGNDRFDEVGEPPSGATVVAWSLKRRRRVAEFPVAWDMGCRLALTSGTPTYVVAAAYNSPGVTGYDLDGTQRWQRRDLRLVQSVRAIRGPAGEPWVALGFDRRPLTIVDARTGVTHHRIGRVRDIYTGDNGAAFHELTHAGHIVSGGHSARVGIESFGVLEVAVSRDAVLVSEVGGPLRCFSYAGEPRWTLDTGKGWHALSVAWHPVAKVWLAALFCYQRKGHPRWLWRIDRTGKMVHRRRFMASSQAFSPGGRALVICGHRQIRRVIDPITGAALWTPRL